MISRATLLGLAGALAIALAVSVAVSLGPTTTARDRTSPSSPVTPGSPAPTAEERPARWLSGAAGAGVTDGAFADWRGRPTEIAGTWNDNAGSHEAQYSLQPGFEFGSWERDLDNAVGAIYQGRGETWSLAADGAYDARWARLLQNVAASWGDRPGTLYLRFAHEFNGTWFPWAVAADEVEDFKEAWRRFRVLQLRHAPDAELVFCPNFETAASPSYDWREAYPGDDQVDVLAVDSYNQYPFVETAEGFQSTVVGVDEFGAPRGLEIHRRFAEAAGKPFAVAEWSSNADMGDSAAFMTAFHDWLETHGGTGPGQVLYEIAFNVAEHQGGRFQLFPDTSQPDAAKAYRRLW